MPIPSQREQLGQHGYSGGQVDFCGEGIFPCRSLSFVHFCSQYCCCHSWFSHLIFSSKLFFSQPIIFTVYASNSLLQPLAGGRGGIGGFGSEGGSEWQCGLDSIRGSTKLRNTIPKPWHTHGLKNLTCLHKSGLSHSLCMQSVFKAQLKFK